MGHNGPKKLVTCGSKFTPKKVPRCMTTTKPFSQLISHDGFAQKLAGMQINFRSISHSLLSIIHDLMPGKLWDQQQLRNST